MNKISRNRLIVSVVAFFVFGFTAVCQAVELTINRDDFTETTSYSYQGTVEESMASGIAIVIKDYRFSDDTVWVGISPVSQRATSCDKNYVLFKDSSGVIHKGDLEERELKICIGRIPVAWIRDKFSIRLPMYSGTKDGTFDTRMIDYAKIRTD